MLDIQDNTLTILVCCYNSGKTLRSCLDSLVGQTISSSNYKILFINDASTDDSFEIANSYSKSFDNFALLNNDKNEGLVNCCNKALDAIETSYFMRIDADDYLSSDAIEKILKELCSSKKKNFIVFKRWDIWDNELKKAEPINDIFTWIAAGTVFKTQTVRSVGAYSDEYWEEYDLYIKLLEAGNKYKISPYRIYYYRRGQKSMTQDYEKNKLGYESLLMKWGLETLRKYGDFKKILKYYRI